MSLKEHWYIAARSRELKRKPIVSRIFEQNIVLFRDSRGEARALLDRCAHRNLPLSLGKVADDCIECSYHGWKYRGDGTCAEIPSLVNGEPPSIRVPSFPCRESQGFIWVYPGQKEPDESPFSFPHLPDEKWYTFVMKTRFQSSVEACLENFLDCPHTVHVHQTLFRSGKTEAIDARVVREGDTARAEFRGEPMSDSIVSRLLLCNGRRVNHTDRFILPNISRVDYEFAPNRHVIIVSQCTPISDLETEVYTAMTYCFGSWGWLVRPFFEPLSRRIIQQDVEILEHHGSQIREYGGTNYNNAETDLLGLHIQSMRKKAERGEPQADQPIEKHIKIRF